MDNTRLNFFKRIYYSAAGFDNYRHFISQRIGKSVIYLLLLSLILGLIGLIQPFIMFNKLMDEVIVDIDKSLPDFTLENGKLHVEGKMPIIIEGATTIIIDTSGNTDESILSKYDSVILITQDKMIQKNFASTQDTNFSVFAGVKMNKENIKKMLPIMKGLSIFIFIIMPFFVIAGRFISAFAVSIIGIIVNSSKNLNLPYRDIFAISAHSLTVPLLIGIILDLVGIPMLYSTVIFYLISGIYIWGALNSIKKHTLLSQLPPLE